MKLNIIENSKIPSYVTHVTETLEKAGFEAFLVGGCVRDLLINRTPKDWDITTNATPEQMIPLFEKTVYENTFGTVTVIHETVSGETYQIEVTPYRIDADYSDSRHPDEVHFSKNIEDDLKRRDFTINAIAYSPHKGQLIDCYKGQDDIKDKVIRAVDDPSLRFQEDALRMLRAVRFSAQLGFAISYDTMSAIIENSHLLKNISQERIRDEFTKIIMSTDPVMGVGLLSKLGLFKYMIPELEEGIGCEQKGEHIYDVWEHLLHALGHAGEKDWPLEIRLAALFHDIGKPRTRRWDPTKASGKGKYTFYGHEVIGARMAKVIMERLKYPKKVAELVVKLVRNHMFFSDTEQITLSAVRRVIQKVGKDHIWELMEIRECDRVGMKKKEAPYRLRKYHAMIDEVLRDPISVAALAIDGEVLIKELEMKPSRRMGWILHALLEEVLEDPKRNNLEYLKERALELDKLEEKDLLALGEKAKELKEKLDEEEIAQMHAKHGIKR
jgi:tRNA nucleotidyltransferase (CCA-adding enzyme)